MEEMLWKFPHIGQNIFKKLSNLNLAKCKKVSKTWEYFITNDEFSKQRVHYETKQKETDATYPGGNTPLHDAAKNGNLSKCKMIINHVENKNPRNNIGLTPLHMAA